MKAKSFQLIQTAALSAVLMLSAAPAAYSAALDNTVQKLVRQDGRMIDAGNRHDSRGDHGNDRGNGHDNNHNNRWSDHGSRHDHRENHWNDHWNGHGNDHHNNHWSDRQRDQWRDYGPGYYPGQRYMFPLYDGRPNNRYDNRHRHYPGYRQRYYNGRYYYFNNSGFFFPGYGIIAYGHRHTRHCPHWHFEDFASGVILGAIISH